MSALNNPTSAPMGVAGAYGQSNTDFYAQYSAQQPINTDWGTNGRVFFDIKKPVPEFDLYPNSNKSQAVFENTLNYSQEGTPLSNAYFSKENVEMIQRDIRNTVYELCQRDTDPILSPHKPIRIGNQNEMQLQIIMRSIFLQYAKHLDYNIGQQIRELNDLVIRESVPGIITNLKQYLGYSADIQRLPMPMDLPQYPSSKGEKTYSLLIV
jgi:hypothetical protein